MWPVLWQVNTSLPNYFTPANCKDNCLKGLSFKIGLKVVKGCGISNKRRYAYSKNDELFFSIQILSSFHICPIIFLVKQAKAGQNRWLFDIWEQIDLPQLCGYCSHQISWIFYNKKLRDSGNFRELFRWFFPQDPSQLIKRGPSA